MAVPHYPDVPAEWKHPFGPYRQAPPEYGGDWYYVYPFNQEPWKTAAPSTDPPADFVAVFGPRPHIRDQFYGEWTQNLAAWKGVSLPEWMTQAQLDEANLTFQAWGMGKAAVYASRYGYSARFPETTEFDFEQAAWSLINIPHFVVAAFQVHLLQEGKRPAKMHPFVPPQLLGENP